MDHRTTLNGIFWWLHPGAKWREVPARYGKWQSVYDRFNVGRKDGTLDRMLERLHLRLNEEGPVEAEPEDHFGIMPQTVDRKVISVNFVR